MKYEGEGRRQDANAFAAAARLHDATMQEWGRERVGEHEAHGQAPLFHYTSSAGFKGILQSKVFWATHIRDFDDEKELRHAFEIASELIDHTAEKTKSRVGLAMLAGTKSALNHFEQYFDVYAVSLCERLDLEPMWQGYADGDRGFGLEIVPVGNPDEAIAREDQPLIICRKVLYDEEQQRHLFQRAIDRVLAQVVQVERMYGSFGARHPCKPFSLLLFHILFDYSASFKRADPYSTEHEWRYFRVLPLETEEAKAVKTRMRGKKKVRYVELDLWKQRHGDLRLSRVIAGNHCSQPEIDAVRDVLSKMEGDPIPLVRRSDLPPPRPL